HMEALIKDEELEKMRLHLVKRRSGVREQIMENTRSVKSERDEIDHLMKEHNYYVPEIMEIIATVDKLCGLVAKQKIPEENT
ncbi:MAG: hypothetical protein J6N76_01575, partial [Lachnospiraceae bacterium]|nr:hypothetical protein [Lachnospiraceae bacterium]